MDNTPISEFALRKCWLKEQFGGRTKAAAAANRINRGAGKRRHLDPYHCPCCHAWHIGGARKSTLRGSR